MYNTCEKLLKDPEGKNKIQHISIKVYGVAEQHCCLSLYAYKSLSVCV